MLGVRFSAHTNTIRYCSSGRFCCLWSLSVKPVSGIMHSLRKCSGMTPSSFRLCHINFLDKISSRNLWITGNALLKAFDKYGQVASLEGFACLHFYQLWMEGRLFLSAVHISIENCQAFLFLPGWYVKTGYFFKFFTSFLSVIEYLLLLFFVCELLVPSSCHFLNFRMGEYFFSYGLVR